MKESPFFIIGIGRSGTTLLRMMLHNHPRIAIPYESHFIVDYCKKVSEYGDLENDDNVRSLIKNILSESIIEMWDYSFSVEKVFEKLEERSVRGVIDAIYKEYANDKGKTRWGDKSDYLDRIDILCKVFPDAQFIHIIRDGRDVASSVMKMPWGPNDIIDASEWWNSHVWVAHRMGAVLGEKRYIEVHYEKLVEDPEKELRRLCAFLEEEYAPDMLNYHKKSEVSIPDDRKWQHHNVNKSVNRSRTYAWKSEMAPTSVAVFNKYAGKMLKELGYENSSGNISALTVNVTILKTYAARFIKMLTSAVKPTK